MSLKIFVDNDHTLKLENLQDQDGNAITSATVEAEVLDRDGNQVSGISQPITLTHQSNGNYEGTLDSSAELNFVNSYTIKITATKGSTKAVWQPAVDLETRT